MVSMSTIGASALSRLIALANTKALDVLGGVNVTNVRNLEFGAVGNGTTNDTIAVQLAINTAIAAGAKAIYFPNGIYFVTALTNANQVVFFGDDASFTGGYVGTIKQVGDHVSEATFAAHSAETVTGAYNAKGHGLVGNGTTDDYTSLSALLTTIGSAKATIIFPFGTYKLSTNITIPANVTLWMMNGAMLSPDSGVTATINGAIDAGLYQVFTGVGSVLGSPKTKVVYPEWFGLNSSSTNNAPAINKAIQFLPITGGIVEFGLGGWYSVTESIVINKSAVRLKGQGTGNSTNIKAVDHTFNIITSDSSITQIEDLSISATNAVSSAYAIYSTNSLRVNNVSIDGVHSGIYSSGAGVRISNVTIRNIKASSGIGINFAEGNEVKEVHSVIMENASGSNAFAGIRITGGSGYTISNCQLMKMGVALYINASTSHIPSIAVSNTWFDTSSYGVRILTSNNMAVQRIRFSNCWFGGNTAHGLQVAQGFVKGLTVENSEFFGNTNDGFSIATGTSVDGIKINSCSFAGNGGSGISIGAGVSDFMITNNRVGPCADFGANLYGVYIAAGVSNHYIITGNDAHGNTSGQINDGGTGANKVVANNLTA